MLQCNEVLYIYSFFRTSLYASGILNERNHEMFDIDSKISRLFFHQLRKVLESGDNTDVTSNKLHKTCDPTAL